MFSYAEIVFYILISLFAGGVYLFRRNKWRVAMLCVLALLLATAFGSFNIFGLDTSVITNYVHRARLFVPEFFLFQQFPALIVYFLTLLLSALTCIIFTAKAPYTMSKASAVLNVSTLSKIVKSKNRLVSFNRIGFVLRN